MAGQGLFSTFNDTVTPMRTVSNLIRIIDPQDVKCISYFGLNNQKKFKLLNFPNHEYEWLTDTLRTRTAIAIENLDTNATQEVTMTAGQGVRFTVDSVWLVQSTGELIQVTSRSTDAVTFARGVGDTSPTAATQPQTLEYLYSAREEGAESTSGYWTTPASVKNYSQIMQAELKISGSEMHASTRYGMPDAYKYQLQKLVGGAGSGAGKFGRAGDLMIDLEKTFFYGQKVQRADGVKGMMGGFKKFVTTNVDAAASATLTEDRLTDMLESCWSEGGMPDVIICNSFQRRLISSWYRDIIRTERSERTGGVRIDHIENDFGEYDIIMNRFCPSDEVYIAQRDTVGWVTLRDWHVHPIQEGGDYKKDEVLGEFGFVVTSEKANGVITGLADS